MDKSIKILSDLTHYMKYAKYLPEKERRETYEETVDRNKNMHLTRFPDIKDEIEGAYEDVYQKKVLPSMRSMQFAGTAIEVNPTRMFNCSFLPIIDYHCFSETMFLLLSGSGVGFSVQKHHVEKLPEIRKPLKTRRYFIQDSIEGWSEAVRVLMKSFLGDRSFPLFDYRGIREKGVRLITSGGKAPGAEPLKVCLNKIETLLRSKKDGEQLSTIDCHDIQCIIADAVLAGGIRRSALISLFSIDDNQMLKAKSPYDCEIDDIATVTKDGSHQLNLTVLRDNEFVCNKQVFVSKQEYEKILEENRIEWYHLYPERARSNNSMVIVRSQITKDKFHDKWQTLKDSGSGEPGFYFTNDKDMGTNPCCEIGLNPFQFCNLTSVNVSDIETQEDLNNRVKNATIIGTLQASYTDFHYLRPEWKKITEQESLLGVSLTGLASINIYEFDFNESATLAVEENERIAKLLNINPAKRITCIKPEGTGSLVLGTSSGVHAWHHFHYKRRMRVAKNEEIYGYLKKKLPSLVEDEVYGTGAVITIPVKAPLNAITRREEVIDFLERIKHLNTTWVANGHQDGMNTHNVSATVSIKDWEWNKVRDWMWDNQSGFNGLSFLPYDTSTYVQAPFEDCDNIEYLKLLEKVKQINLTEIREMNDYTTLQGELACAGGSCEIF